MPALEKKEGKASKGEMAPDKIAGLLRADRKFGRPSHFKQTRLPLRLESGIVEHEHFHAARLLIQQQENPA